MQHVDDPLVISAASLSLCCSTMVVTTYLIFSDLQKLRYVELLCYIAMNDIFFSIGTLLGKVEEGSIACFFQGIVGSASCVSSAFWTTVITYQLYLACVEGKVMRHLFWYRVTGILGPLLFALLPLTTNTYAPDGVGNYCFIDSNGLFVMWRILSLYLWIILAVVIQTVLLCLIARRLWILQQDSSNVSKIWTSMWKLAWYPAIFILCWTPDAMVNLDKEESALDQDLSLIAILLMTLEGVWFAIVFFFCNKVVRQRWYYLIRNLYIDLLDRLGYDWRGLLEEDVFGNELELGCSTNDETMKDLSRSASPSTQETRQAGAALHSSAHHTCVQENLDPRRSSGHGTTSRPSLMELGPNAIDVTSEVDYVQPAAERREERNEFARNAGKKEPVQNPMTVEPPQELSLA